MKQTPFNAQPFTQCLQQSFHFLCRFRAELVANVAFPCNDLHQFSRLLKTNLTKTLLVTGLWHYRRSYSTVKYLAHLLPTFRLTHASKLLCLFISRHCWKQFPLLWHMLPQRGVPICMSSVTLVHPAKATRQNEMPFHRDTCVVPSNTELEGTTVPPRVDLEVRAPQFAVMPLIAKLHWSLLFTVITLFMAACQLCWLLAILFCRLISEVAWPIIIKLCIKFYKFGSSSNTVTHIYKIQSEIWIMIQLM